MLIPGAATLLSLGLVRPTPEAQTAASFRGPFVVVGMGDSGTGSVKRMLEKFGVAMCNYSATCHEMCQRSKRIIKPARRQNDGLGGQDNEFTKPAQEFIRALLNSSGGHVSQASTYQNSSEFELAVAAELTGSNRTRDCILTQQRDRIQTVAQSEAAAAGVPNADASEDFIWGFKNPRHLFLLPVMDRAFNSTQRMLAVARDPRDICTGQNRDQFKAFGHLVALRDRHEPLSQDEETACFRFWANVWDDILQEYGQDPRFRVVRIEDLVLPDPAQEGNGARKVMDCVLRHAELPPPSPEAARSWLDVMHNHTDSYAGNPKSPKEKSRLESFTSLMEGHVQNTMRLLGYSVDRYGVIAPGIPTVCT